MICSCFSHLHRYQYFQHKPVFLRIDIHFAAIFPRRIPQTFQTISVELRISLRCCRKHFRKFHLLLTIIFKPHDQKILLCMRRHMDQALLFLCDRLLIFDRIIQRISENRTNIHRINSVSSTSFPVRFCASKFRISSSILSR